MADETHPILDHLAIALRSRTDGYDPLVLKFGGRWHLGGDAGEFAPGQLAYPDLMKIELVQPGAQPGGFVNRFLDRNGPGAHHITFHIDDVDQFAAECRALGFDVVPDFVDVPGMREMFVHPKVTGFGTLLQVIQNDDHPGANPESTPAGFPTEIPHPSRIEWVAIQVPHLELADAMFGKILHGVIIDTGSADGVTWNLYEWVPARRLLVFSVQDPELAGRPVVAGVDHVLFAPQEASAAVPRVILAIPPADPDPLIGLNLLELSCD